MIDNEQADQLDALLRDACKSLVQTERECVDYWQQQHQQGHSARTELLLGTAVELLAERLHNIVIHVPTYTYTCANPRCSQLHRSTLVGQA